MNLGFSRLLATIHAELGAEYIGGAVQWADKKFDCAWSKAMDRFEHSLSVAIERKDYNLAQSEGDIYKGTILDLIRKYKAEKHMSDAEAFLASIGGVR